MKPNLYLVLKIQIKMMILMYFGLNFLLNILTIELLTIFRLFNFCKLNYF